MVEGIVEDLDFVALLEEFVEEEGRACRGNFMSGDLLVDDRVDQVWISQLHRIDRQERELVFGLQLSNDLYCCCCLASTWHA